ncbi:hypothetical protein AB0O51_05690 [Streptomyces sp. NPDC090301]|uniref:hypothetical protein n=1 Tax=Streptomyces sp. NPDC090301 TaxID=3154975 RepID=UPI0034373CB1
MSARRAAQLAMLAQRGMQEDDSHGCPAELRAPCVVWDWLRAEERPAVERLGMNATEAISAWRRWLNARRAYAADVGATEFEACGPGGRPTLG